MLQKNTCLDYSAGKQVTGDRIMITSKDEGKGRRFVKHVIV